MIVKQAIDVSFAKGLDTKSDPKRVQIGNFVSLENTVFTKGGLLQKRNGYAQLQSLPNTSSAYLTTFKDNLTAVGTSITAYSTGTSSWVSKGTIRPLSLSVLPLVRNNLNQTASDAVIAPNGLVCTAYVETDGSTITNKYMIADSVTGQNIVAPTPIPVASGTVSGGMRVFLLGNSFVIVFTNTITGTAHLQYIAISTLAPTIVSANTDLAAAYITATTLSWDALVVGGSTLYFMYNQTAGAQSIKVGAMSSAFVQVTQINFPTYKATMCSIAADVTNGSPILYFNWYDLSATKGYTLVLNSQLNTISGPVRSIASGTILNLASAAQNGSCKLFYEVSNAYAWNAAIKTNFINSVTITPLLNTFNSVFASGAGTITAASTTGLVNGMYLVDNTTAANIAAGTTFTISGSTLTLSINTAGNSASSPGDLLAALTISSVTTIVRSVGLASKAFIVDGVIYFLSAYSSPYQPTYFLINGSTSLSSSPVVVSKLAYSNGGGYLTTGLPGVTVDNITASIPYLLKDLIQAVNKNTNVTAGTQVNGIYSQTGLNIASFTLGTEDIDTAEIGNDLHLSGGFLWMYDGILPVEHNFFLWPDTDTGTPANSAAWSATGGSIVAQPDGATNTSAYYYQFTYEWTDNQGNAFRSAPSIPIPVTTTGSGTSGSVTLNIPALRLTYKVASKVKLVVYRWSVAQQIYYQTTSISAPTLNDPTVDTIQFVDTNADATILGNNIIYTTGGVVEDVNAPATNLMTLFDTRLWLVTAEDPNLLWYSKQVIESVPVEMSDLLTLYIAPTTGTQGSTGPTRALSVMDDKLVIFKKDAIYYINGQGPDNTGANNQYSQPIFVTSTVGCDNQKSIVLMNDGLMFQSDKGIWLLNRNMGSSYIGAPVEGFTSGATVMAAQSIPETNQVRFILDSGITLMYDYYYQQWSTFIGAPAISSCIFQGLHTFINSYGAAYQESPGLYVDGSTPVLMSFITGPINFGTLQGYQRAYEFFLLGEYITPFRLSIQVSYDYGPFSGGYVINPTNFNPAFGGVATDGPFGQAAFGGTSLFEWRVFLKEQRCKAFAISIQELYDGSFGVPAGAGLTLSGLNVVLGFKNKWATPSAAHSVG